MRIFTYEQLMLNGRLGNQLWQIASTIGLAEREAGIALFKPDWEYRKFFCLPDEYFGPIPGDMEIVDRGTEYLQDVEYLGGVEHYVKEWFKPSELSREHLRMHYDVETFEAIPNKVALHVRRGDYLKYPNHFSQMTDRYYDTALEMLGDVRVFVFSDDIRWCRQHFDGRGFDFVDGVIRPVEVAARMGDPKDQWDLFLMSMCDRHIISNSTFSWWGAWLSQNPHPIYPDKWFESELAYIPAEKMFTEEWTKVSC